MKEKIKKIIEKFKKDKDFNNRIKELKKKDPFVYKNF